MIQGVFETLVGFGARVLKHIIPCPHSALLEKVLGFLCQDTTKYDGVDELSESISNHSLQDKLQEKQPR